ncbi:MAG: diaminopimelate decarboxylase [Betaproteobacteria bacterium]|nr:diaminopimelate decarboxylase [Betaproteobacteria bacterium]
MDTTSVATTAREHDVRLAALASECGTPLYVYNLTLIRARVLELKRMLDPVGGQLFFAVVANDRPEILRVLAEMGVGACVNSMPHLMLAHGVGIVSADTQFTATGITLQDMRRLQELKVRANLDSLSQLEAWLDLGATEAGIRLNAASLGGSRSADRLGIPASELPTAVSIAARVNARLTGVHVYLGTSFQSPEEMLPTLRRAVEVAAGLPSLSYVNIGGGIGVDYEHRGRRFNLSAFGDGLADCARFLSDRVGRPVDLVFEPGRALVAECATFVTTVTDVKELRGERFVGVDGSIAVFPRPLVHPESPHSIRWIGPTASDRSGPLLRTSIVGRSSFSGDILGVAQLPGDLRVGDLLAFDDAGAYLQSVASRFLGQPEPSTVFLR